MAMNDLKDHEYLCGAKTEICYRCRKYIPLKDYEEHMNMDDCEPDEISLSKQIDMKNINLAKGKQKIGSIANSNKLGLLNNNKNKKSQDHNTNNHIGDVVSTSDIQNHNAIEHNIHSNINTNIHSNINTNTRTNTHTNNHHNVTHNDLKALKQNILNKKNNKISGHGTKVNDITNKKSDQKLIENLISVNTNTSSKEAKNKQNNNKHFEEHMNNIKNNLNNNNNKIDINKLDSMLEKIHINNDINTNHTNNNNIIYPVNNLINNINKPSSLNFIKSTAVKGNKKYFLIKYIIVELGKKTNIKNNINTNINTNTHTNNIIDKKEIKENNNYNKFIKFGKELDNHNSYVKNIKKMPYKKDIIDNKNDKLINKNGIPIKENTNTNKDIGNTNTNTLQSRIDKIKEKIIINSKINNDKRKENIPLENVKNTKNIKNNNNFNLNDHITNNNKNVKLDNSEKNNINKKNSNKKK
jgi:hypothetical protein